MSSAKQAYGQSIPRPGGLLVALILLGGVLGTACGRSQPAVSEPVGIIARVDDRFFTTDDLRVIDPEGALPADEVGIVVENWIERELLLKIADRRGVLADTSIRWQIEAARSEVVIRGLGKIIRDEAGDETGARRAIERDLVAERKSSHVESYPWKVK